MSKYKTRLQEMNKAYSWVNNYCIKGLANYLKRIKENSAIIIGSGGSFSVASYISTLHSEFTSQLAKAMTPLEYINSKTTGDSAVIIISTSGKNQDIINTLREAIAREHKNIIVVCANPNAPLISKFSEYSTISYFNFKLPTKKDGFLAVNSVLIYGFLFLRAYYESIKKKLLLPKEFNEFYLGSSDFETFENDLRNNLTNIIDRDTILVLFGNWGKFAAIDLESKYVESALGNVILSDYRNFGHGRHNWIDKKWQSSSLLAFSDKESENLLCRTFSSIPEKIPKYILKSRYSEGPLAAIELLINTFFIVDLAGVFRNVDPSSQNIPEFGRKLYHMSLTNSELYRYQIWKKEPKIAYILRKFPNFKTSTKQIQNFWIKSLEKYQTSIKKAIFGGIVFDFDGTLCSSERREIGIDDEVLNKLLNLLEHDVKIGIASGRGKSLFCDLNRKIPKEYQNNVFVGYYNGGICSYLSESIDFENIPKNKHINEIHTLLNADEYLKLFGIKIRFKPTQITILDQNIDLLTIYSYLNSRFGQNTKIKMVLSDHSIDIIPKTVTKTVVSDAIQNSLTYNHSFLTIGDKGSINGNDFDLLNRDFSLSVNEVSSSPNNCWNLGPMGFRGVPITLFYLNRIIFGERTFHLNLKMN
ncbi:MAG: HAD hydrolase family protein [Candidatus Heimdallarchaeota archaeon]|nr:HAD hydrolase family protein [Candidatus Heimdallarchaeota archaeon]